MIKVHIYDDADKHLNSFAIVDPKGEPAINLAADVRTLLKRWFEVSEIHGCGVPIDTMNERTP